MSWRQKGLNVLSDPNIAYLLMMLGMAGIFFEIYNPGSIVPGVVGAIAMILALYSLDTLPINYAGLLLIVLSVVMFLLEIKVQSYGVLSIGGAVSFVIGSIMLIDSPLPFLQISWQIIFAATVCISAFFVFAIGMTYRAQKRQPTTGREGLIGERGNVIEDLNLEGTIEVHGEIWNANADEKIKKGQKVEIIEVDSKHLVVKVKSV